MNRRLIYLLTALLIALMAAMPAMAAAKLPEKTDDFYYNDGAGVLSDATKGEIFFANERLNKACGAELVFVTVKTTDGTALADYCYELYNSWGIGGEKSLGLLLVQAIGDDDYYYTLGEGFEAYMTAGDVGELVDKYLEPSFAKKDYDKGTLAFFEALYPAVAKAMNVNVSLADAKADYADHVAQNGTETTGTSTVPGRSDVVATGRPNSPEGEGDGFKTVLGGIILIVILIWIFSAIGRRRRRRMYPPTGGYYAPPRRFFGWGAPRGPRPPMGGFGGPTPPPPGGFGGGPSRPMGGFGGGPSRPSGGFGGGPSRSSGGFGSGSSRPSGGFGGASRSSGSFGGSSRSSGFGGASRSGGGHTRGGGGGRGRR